MSQPNRFHEFQPMGGVLASSPRGSAVVRTGSAAASAVPGDAATENGTSDTAAAMSSDEKRRIGFLPTDQHRTAVLEFTHP